AALILSSFMAGLALGSAIAARLTCGGFDRFAFTLDWNRSSPSLAGRWYLDFPARTMAASHFPSVLASPGAVKRPALLNFVPASASSDHGYGVDPARAVGGSTSI